MEQSGHPLPFSPREVAERFGTPTWIYRRSTIEQRLKEVQVFETVRYAQKANPNLAILEIVRQNGGVVDSVSAGEVARALRIGFDPLAPVPGVMYTADLFDAAALKIVGENRVPVNIGSPDMLDQMAGAGISVPVTIRVNPGFGHGHSRKTNTGGELSKHGVWHGELASTVRRGRELGLDIQGLHLHIGSGTDFAHLSRVCDAMVEAAHIFGPGLRTISAGGGLPISYKKGAEATEPIDLVAYHKLWDEARKRIEAEQGHPVALEVEPGRYIVAESGYLLSEIRAIKRQGNTLFYLVDAGFNELIRPSFYGSYHHITVVPHDNRLVSGQEEVVIGGPLCESGDVFTQEEGGVVVTRRLPRAEVGDYLVLHDAGAYGAAMSSRYNSRPLAAEVLESGGKYELIRERETLDDLCSRELIPLSLR